MVVEYIDIFMPRLKIRRAVIKMLHRIYQFLRNWSNWLSPKLIRNLRSFGTKLSELGTEDQVVKFYRALDHGDVSEAQYWFDQMVMKVGKHPQDLDYADHQLIRAYTFLQDEINYHATEEERKKSFSEVTKYLDENLKDACGEIDMEPDPDLEDTEITDTGQVRIISM